MASAYWTIAALVWGALAAFAGLGWWLRIPALLLAPVLPVALPLLYIVLRAIRRVAEGLTSSMPTPELRRLERAAKDGHAGPAADLVKAGLRITDKDVGRSLLRSALK